MTVTFTTLTDTIQEVVRTTPVTTVTVSANAKRDAATMPDPTPRAIVPDEVSELFNLFKRQAASSGTDSNSMSAAFSSACACQNYPSPTVTATYTDEMSVRQFCFARLTRRLTLSPAHNIVGLRRDDNHCHQHKDCRSTDRHHDR